MRFRLLRDTALAGGVIAGMLVFAPAQAQAQTWDGDTSTLWGTGTNWNADVVPAGGGVVIINNGALANQPTLNVASAALTSTTISAGTLIVDNTLTSPIVTLSGTGNLTINATRQVIGNVTQGGTGTLLNNGTITGTLGITNGTVNNAGAVTGTTTISGGTLNLNAGTNLANLQTLTVDGGTVNVNSSDTVGALQGISGTITIAGGQFLTLANGVGNAFGGVITGAGGLGSAFGSQTLFGANDYTGTTTISGGTLQIGNGGTTGTLGTGAVVIVGGAQLLFNRSDDVTASNAISGFGSLQKFSAGNLTLSGVLSHTGLTTIDAGTLTLTNAGNTNSGGITINGLTTRLVIGASGAAGTGNITTNGSIISYSNGVTSSAPIVLNSATTQLEVLNADVATQSGVISEIGGARPLEKIGTGTLVLTASNTYNGTTTISGGILQIGDGGTSGTLGTGAVTNNATLTFNRSNALTVFNNISGTGALIKNGAGNLTLSGALSYSGVTTVNAGTLTLTNAANTNSGGIVINGVATRLVIGATGAAGTGTITANGSVISYADTVNSAAPIVINSNTTQLEVLVGSATQSGIISETGGPRPLEKIGAGTLILSGANTYSGGTTISAGILQVGAGGASGTLGTGSVVNNASLTFNRSDTFTVANNISGTGGLAHDGTGTLILTGANSYGGSTSITNGALVVGNGGTAGTLGTGTVTNNFSLTFNRSDALTVSNAISGSGAVNQIGAGTTTLTGANTYSGITTISAGALNIQNATALGTTAGGTVVSGGAALEIQGGITVGAEALTLNGTGVSNDGALRNISGANTYGGAITLASASRINSDSGTLTLSGGITGAGQNLVFGGAGNTTITTANATGIGALVKDGAGTLTIGTGRTLSAQTINNNAGIIAIGDGATLQGLGNTLNNAATINVATNGTVTDAGNINNLATGIINFNGPGGTGTLASTTNLAIVNDGQINVNSGGVNVTGNVTNQGSGSFTLGAGAGTVAMSGSFSNNGAATLVVNGGTLNGITTLTNASSALVGISVAAGGTLGAAIIQSNSGSRIDSLGTINATTSFTNNGTANMQGILNTPLVSNTGVFNLTGNLAGPMSVFNNSGTLVATAPGATTLATTTFNNLATGIISQQNNAPGNELNITGAYVGTAGSRIVQDIILSNPAGGAANGDQVRILGIASGQATLVFNPVGSGRAAFGAAIPVLRVGAGSTLTVNEGVINESGFYKYFLRKNPVDPTLFEVVSQFNSGPAAGVASGLSGLISALQAGFHQPASAIISRPDSCTPNQLIGGPFIRLSQGETNVKTNSNGDVQGGGSAFSASSKSDSRFTGFQTGADAGLCNINNTGWNIHGGIMGGLVDATSTGKSRTPSPVAGSDTFTLSRAEANVPFIGAYTFVTNGPFTFEANVRQDFYDMKISAVDPSTGSKFVETGQKLKGDSTSFNTSMAYRFIFSERYYIEPQVGLSKATTTFGILPFATNANDFMRFNGSDSLMARAGANIGAAFQVTDTLIIVPFATASVWRELGSKLKANAVIGSSNQVFNVQSDRIGTFGQAGGGLQFRILNSPFLGFVRGDVRFGDKIDGRAVNAGLRMQF